MNRFDKIKGEKAAIEYHDDLKFLCIITIIGNHVEPYFVNCYDKMYEELINGLDNSFVKMKKCLHINTNICKKYRISRGENIIEKNSYVAVLYTENMLRVININVGSELQALTFCSILEESGLVSIEEGELIGY